MKMQFFDGADKPVSKARWLKLYRAKKAKKAAKRAKPRAFLLDKCKCRHVRESHDAYGCFRCAWTTWGIPCRRFRRAK